MDNNEVVYVAQAFKFPSEKKNCEVVDVIWNMSKTHYAIPKIQIAPTQLAGTTVSYCTGYNAKYIFDNKIGPGTIVEVEKRGEIIPNVNKVVKPTYPAVPDTCPDCGGKLIWSGYHLCCNNSDCANASQQDIVCWIANLAPVDGFGSKLQLKHLQEVFGDDITVERIMDGTLKKYLNQAFPSAQFQLFQKMIDKLYNSKYSLTSAIKALNIPRLGEVNAAKLAQYPEYVKVLMCMCPTSEMMSELRANVGNANIDSIIENIDKLHRLEFIKDRIDWSSPVALSDEVVKVAITGKLSVKRADFEKLLSSRGYKVADISKDTKFLITDDPNSPSSKNKKADAWGIVKISEEDFRRSYLK